MSNSSRVVVDLSHLAADEQHVVGQALARSAVSALGRLGRLPTNAIIGRLGPGTWGIIAPHDLRSIPGIDSAHIDRFEEVLSKVR